MKLIILAVAFLLSACGGGSGDSAPAQPTGAVQIECVDLQTACAQQVQPAVQQALSVVVQGKTVDLGAVHFVTPDPLTGQTQTAQISALIGNTTLDTYSGFVYVVLDNVGPNCAQGFGLFIKHGFLSPGAWPVLLGNTVTIEPGETVEGAGVGAGCSGADLGPGTITFSLYDSQICMPPEPDGQVACWGDETTLRDRVVGEFVVQ